MAGGAVLALTWLGAVLLLGAVARPLSARVFARPVTAAAFAVPLGLAWLTLGTYWLGRLSLRNAPIGAVVLLTVVALVVRSRGGATIPPRATAEAAAVFAAGFGLVLAVQFVDPDVTALGEAYWNFGLLQSLGRTARLPPQDPWFAGEPVRYYYGGHLLVAALAGLLDTAGRSAFPLGKAVVFGALLTAAYGVGGTVAAARDHPHRPAGLLAAWFAGLASDLHPVVWSLLGTLPDGAMEAGAGVLAGGGATVPTAGPYSFVEAAHFSFTNTDFPAYLVVVGSFHPHYASPPFLLLLVGVLLAYHVTPAAARRRRFALLALATPLVGLVALVNTWSLPAAGGLVALAVALAPAHPRSLGPATWSFRWLTPGTDTSPARDWAGRLAAGGLAGLGVGLLGLLSVAPYVLRGLAGDPGLGLLPDRSGPWFFVVGYGGFLAVFAVYLTARLRTEDNAPGQWRVALATGAGLLATAWLVDFPGLVLVGPVLLGGLWHRWRNPADPLALLLVAGAGLVLLVELAYVREPAEPGRYNTVYKVFTQTWVLWGPAAGVALARLTDARTNRTGPRLSDRRLPTRRQAAAGLLVVALSGYLVAGLGVYTGQALAGDARGSLDGLAYLDDAHPDHAAAIDWLAARPGQPVLVSAPATEGRRYRFHASPAASLTGLPTLVGWDHEADYRGQAAYRERVAAVDAVYDGSVAERARVLRTHDVDFVWVGPAERARYDVVDFGGDPGLEVAFSRGTVTVYRVDRSALVAT